VTGYEKLKLSVENDCNDGNKCFNPNGCDKHGAKCFHEYCDKFKWTIDRAKHYGEKLGLNWEDVLNSWEEKRNYWYMNYYQESNQPEIRDNVRVFETTTEMLKNIGHREFRCPACGGVSTSPYKCDSGFLMGRGRGKRKAVCNWNVGGLFGDMGKGVYVYCKDKLAGETIFMPISWESERAL